MIRMIVHDDLLDISIDTLAGCHLGIYQSTESSNTYRYDICAGKRLPSGSIYTQAYLEP